MDFLYTAIWESILQLSKMVSNSLQSTESSTWRYSVIFNVSDLQHPSLYLSCNKWKHLDIFEVFFVQSSEGLYFTASSDWAAIMCHRHHMETSLKGTAPRVRWMNFGPLNADTCVQTPTCSTVLLLWRYI